MATIAENLKLIPLPKNTMVVARRDGRLFIVDFTEFPQLDDPTAIDWDLSVSKIIIGKLQLIRSRVVSIEGVEIENVVRTQQVPSGATSDLEVTLYGATDGKNIDMTFNPTKTYESDSLVEYGCRATAENFSLQLRGTYNVNTIVFTLHNHGRR